MMGGDRIVTTAFIRALNQIPECDELQLGAVLHNLEIDALHVLVPTGHTHGLTESKIVCQAHLAVGGFEPLVKEVLLSPKTYESLPTSFHALTVARELVPATVGKVDAELEELLGSGDISVGLEAGRDDTSTEDTPEGRVDRDL
jgi:hypothetical protein